MKLLRCLPLLIHPGACTPALSRSQPAIQGNRSNARDLHSDTVGASMSTRDRKEFKPVS